MDYKEQIDRLRSEISELENSELAVELFDGLITDLLARAEAAEGRAEKAERERDAAVSDLETIMAYNSDTCQFCKNGQCYVRGGTKSCLPKWRGQKEE